MLKAKAIELLGGTTASAAAAIGVSYQAVVKWPEELPVRIEDRVLAALARKHLPAEVIGGAPPPSGIPDSAPAPLQGVTHG